MSHWKRNALDSHITLTPMADIAFLLLIFFISTAVFVFEEGIPVLLPLKGETPLELKKPTIVTVQVGRDGEVLMGGERIKPRDLVERVTRIMAGDKGVIFSLETHGQAPYGIMVSCLGALREGGAMRISLKELAE